MKQVTYAVYQVSEDKIRDFGFLGYEDHQKLNGPDWKLENYTNVVDIPMEIKGAKEVFEQLEFIYAAMNGHPSMVNIQETIMNIKKVERIRSLSVGDLICVNDVLWFLVDRFGFKRLGRNEVVE